MKIWGTLTKVRVKHCVHEVVIALKVPVIGKWSETELDYYRYLYGIIGQWSETVLSCDLAMKPEVIRGFFSDNFQMCIFVVT